MKIKHSSRVIALALFTLVMAAGYLMWNSVDELTELAIESIGTKKLDADVQLGNLSFDIAGAQVTLEHLSVGNPPGFTSDYAMKFEHIVVSLNPGSIGEGQLLISKIEVSNPEIVYEFSKSGSNIEQLIENASASMDTRKNENDANSRDFIGIDNLVIHTGEVRVEHQRLKGKSLSFELPHIDLKGMTNLNRNSNSESLGEELLVNIKTEIGVAIASASIRTGLETNTKNDD
ncbi:MAG: AsmA family protein [Gammaproteobacteria bacterium]|nr:AsmA family protein [Gammaproteobacteria bacterium]